MTLLGCTKKKNTFPEFSLESENLKGNFHWVKTMEYLVIDKFGELSKGDRYISGVNQLIFDQKGNKTESIWYNHDGNLDSKTVYNYDDNEIPTGSSSYNSDGSLKRTSTFEIDVHERRGA